MLDSIGLQEIFWILVLGLIVIGPERLPGVVQEVKAALYAARKAINNAKAELNGELGEDLQQFREPLNQIASLRSMTPRAVLTKALLDGDDELLDSFDPKKIMASGTVGEAYRQRQAPAQGHGAPSQPAPNPEAQQQRAGFSWEDIT